MFGFHHLRSRTLAGQGVEPFPARGVWKRLLDRLMYGVSILAPLALLPQAASIYTQKSAAGVSLETWILLAIFNVLWVVYGFVHRDRPIIISHILFVILDITIVVGILLF